MATVSKRNIWHGTTYTEGVKTKDASTAEILCLVEDANTHKEAAAAVKTALGTSHPDDSSLPLWAVQVQYFPHSMTKRYCRAVYRHRSNNASNSSSSFDLGYVTVRPVPITWHAVNEFLPEAASVTGYESAAEYLADAKDIRVDNSTGLVIPHTLQTAEWTIGLRTWLDASPIGGALSAIVGKVNGNNFSISGKIFAPGTLLFTGVDQRIIASNNVYEFGIAYMFTHRPMGYFSSYPDYTNGLGATRAAVRKFLNRQYATFNAADFVWSNP